MPFSEVWLSLLWSASLEISPVLGDCFAVAELLEVVPLPVWETVFPFTSVFVCSVTCAVAELGLVADLILLVAYLIVLCRILVIGRKSPTNKGSAICYGVAIYIFLHIAVNLMGILGLMPLTGVPLPFISYGGSFTISLIAALSIVQRISIENGLAKERSLKNA